MFALLNYYFTLKIIPFLLQLRYFYFQVFSLVRVGFSVNASVQNLFTRLILRTLSSFHAWRTFYADAFEGSIMFRGFINRVYRNTLHDLVIVYKKTSLWVLCIRKSHIARYFKFNQIGLVFFSKTVFIIISFIVS